MAFRLLCLHYPLQAKELAMGVTSKHSYNRKKALTWKWSYWVILNLSLSSRTHSQYIHAQFDHKPLIIYSDIRVLGSLHMMVFDLVLETVTTMWKKLVDEWVLESRIAVVGLRRKRNIRWNEFMFVFVL